MHFHSVRLVFLVHNPLIWGEHEQASGQTGSQANTRMVRRKKKPSPLVMSNETQYPGIDQKDLNLISRLEREAVKL